MIVTDRIEAARIVSDSVWVAVDGLDTPNDIRTRVAAALIQISMGHFTAVVTLMREQSVSSAYALVRPQIDAFLRSQWLLFLADEVCLEGFLKGDDPPSSLKIVDSLIQAGIYDESFRIELLPRPLWALVSDFVHGGGFLAVRHITGEAIESRHEDVEIWSVLRLSRGWFYMAASAIASLARNSEISAKLRAIAEAQPK